MAQRKPKPKPYASMRMGRQKVHYLGHDRPSAHDILAEHSDSSTQSSSSNTSQKDAWADQIEKPSHENWQEYVNMLGIRITKWTFKVAESPTSAEYVDMPPTPPPDLSYEIPKPPIADSSPYAGSGSKCVVRNSFMAGKDPAKLNGASIDAQQVLAVASSGQVRQTTPTTEVDDEILILENGHYVPAPIGPPRPHAPPTPVVERSPRKNMCFTVRDLSRPAAQTSVYVSRSQSTVENKNDEKTFYERACVHTKNDIHTCIETSLKDSAAPVTRVVSGANRGCVKHSAIRGEKARIEKAFK